MHLKIVKDEEQKVLARGKIIVVEESATGVRYPLGLRPFRIGSGAGAQVRLDGATDQDVIVTLQADGSEIWLGRDDEMRELSLDEVFTAFGREFCVRRVSGRSPSTIIEDEPLPPVSLSVRMDIAGPVARIEDNNSGAAHELFHTNRAIVLFLLARQWKKDEKGGMAGEDRGWTPDVDVARGVWGRDADARQLKVLICRLRAELRKAGIDGWVIERRRGQLRAHVGNVDIAS
jgi:hypothetical protein